MLIDTHCHVHWADFPIPADEVIASARNAGVMQMICVGTDEKTSLEAIEFAKNHDEAFASIGVHPHNAKDGTGVIGHFDDIIQSGKGTKKIVAIGETGLDYYYNHSPKRDQIKALELQIELALKYHLPIIFHVRDGYDDFWPILDNFHGYMGVAHSFTDTMQNAEKAINRGLYIGVNGISTFTKDPLQQEMFASLPLESILLETDAPYLTPSPLRGKVKCNEPAYIREIAQQMGTVRHIEFDEVARVTTRNARTLFNL